jgi:predicted nuclease of predicted toxin-antitoxin system
MKIVIDECLPKRLIHIFTDHEAWTVPQIGLAGSKNSELLDKLNEKRIEVFITIDGNIEYQQNFSNRTFGTVIIRSVTNRLESLLLLENDLLRAVDMISAGNIIHIPTVQSDTTNAE